MPNMQTFIVGIVIVGVTLVVGIFISSEISDQMDAGSSAQNAANDLVTALSGGTAWITILVVVGFATIVLGMLTSGLGTASQGAGPVY
jgi:uncharacterized membrane protein YjgN (DUF898 family)